MDEYGNVKLFDPTKGPGPSDARTNNAIDEVGTIDIRNDLV